MGDSPGEKRGLSGLRFVGVGVSFGAYTALGWFAGDWIDGRYGFAPYGATVGTLLGVAFAVWDLLRVSAALEREEQRRKR
jgi:F0F1-type ATP synthase assembly protein I